MAAPIDSITITQKRILLFSLCSDTIDLNTNGKQQKHS